MNAPDKVSLNKLNHQHPQDIFCSQSQHP